LAALIGVAADGQAALSFDVISVKPRDPKAFVLPTSICLNGYFRSYNRGIYNVIRQAYDLRSPQSLELERQLPDWADSNKLDAFYDIEAKSQTPVSEARCWLMVRSLLEERFKLAAHWETKEGSIYELVIAPGGHKMQKVTEADTERGLYFTVNGHSRFPPQVPTSALLGITMTNLASQISSSAPDGLGVIDKTGLEGLYKVNLAYSTNPLEYSDPDLLTALQKQLGLKLERRKGPVKHFVLDHIERPTLNEDIR